MKDIFQNQKIQREEGHDFTIFANPNVGVIEK